MVPSFDPDYGSRVGSLSIGEGLESSPSTPVHSGQFGGFGADGQGDGFASDCPIMHVGHGSGFGFGGGDGGDMKPIPSVTFESAPTIALWSFRFSHGTASLELMRDSACAVPDAATPTPTIHRAIRQRLKQVTHRDISFLLSGGVADNF